MKIGQPTYSHQFSGSKRRLVEKWDTYQYVPLHESLRQLLLNDTIRHEIQSFPQRIHDDGLLEDICDGSLLVDILCFHTTGML